MRKLRIIGWVLLAVVVVGSIVWFARPKPAPAPIVITLPDGTKITLAKVTTGPKHRYRYGFGWQEIVYPCLPRFLKAKLRPRQIEFTTTPDKLMFWFDLDKMYMPMGPGSFCFSVADESGLESHSYTFPTTQRLLTPPNRLPTKSGSGSSAAPMPAHQIVAFAVDTIPRRQKEIRLRIYQTQVMQKYKLAGEILIPNPWRTKPAVEWSSETLPVTRTTNGLEITLTKLETGLAASDDRFRGVNHVAPDARGYSRATFQIKENGEPTRSWYVSGLRARNASGEVRMNNMMVPDTVFGTSPFGSSIPQRPARVGFSSVPTNQFAFMQRARETTDSRDVRYNFADPLWPEEPAWRIEVDVMRLAGFASNELWTIKGVRVPKETELVEAPEIITRDGDKLEFIGVSGPGLENSPVPGSMPLSTRNTRVASVQLQLPRALSDSEISLAEVKDETGRKAKPSGTSTASGSGHRTHFGLTLTNDQVLRGLSFEIPQGAKQLDVTLAVVRKGSSSNELWSIKGIRVPKEGELAGSSESIIRDGLKMEFLGISGPALELSPPGISTPRIAPTASVQVRSTRSMTNWNISLVEVKDENGRKAASRGMSSYAMGNTAGSRYGITLANEQVLRGFGFEIPEGAEKLDITLAVSRIQRVQFTAKPTVVTNESQAAK